MVREISIRRRQAFLATVRCGDINLDVPAGQVVVVTRRPAVDPVSHDQPVGTDRPRGTIFHLDGTLLPDEGRKPAQLRPEVGMVFQAVQPVLPTRRSPRT